jgi:hypothetical protein
MLLQEMVIKAVQFKLTQLKVLNIPKTAAVATTKYSFLLHLDGNTVQCELSPP